MSVTTYSQIYIHVVFAVKHRQSLIQRQWEDELYKYITGIVQNKGQKMLAINGMPDHIHVVINIKPACSIADLVREIKKASNIFVREKRFTQLPFEWQEGYGVFSCASGNLSSVINYVMNQKEHHKRRSFQEEYVGFLKEFEIEYREEYLFNWLGNE